MYTKLGELKEAIDGESIVEIMKESELIEEKEPAISEKWKKYSKSIKKEDLNKPVKVLPEYGIRIVFIGE